MGKINAVWCKKFTDRNTIHIFPCCNVFCYNRLCAFCYGNYDALAAAQEVV